MTAIVTRTNDDGTYDSVGTNNRMVVRLATLRGIRNRARRCIRERAYRIEFYHGDRLEGDPFLVEKWPAPQGPKEIR